jgi:site-specific recombinase XerC
MYWPLRWIEHDRKRKRSTVRDYTLTIEANLIDDIGADRKLEAIQPRHLDAYRDRLVAEGRLSPRTINKRLTIIHGVFGRAIKVWSLRANPAAGIDKVPERRSGDIRRAASGRDSPARRGGANGAGRGAVPDGRVHRASSFRSR